MEYNSQKNLLVIPEYGRNIQDLIRHARTIEDKEKRQAYIERVIGLMQQMHPQSRNREDSKLKLWQHVFRIAEWDLDVTPPENLDLEEKARKTPEVIEYPKEVRRFRHYGHNVKMMIQKAIEMEDGPVKDGFVVSIAAFMKMAYRNWHKDLNVGNGVIASDLASMSGGKLIVDQDANLDYLMNAKKNKKGGNSHTSTNVNQRDRSLYQRNKKRRRY